MTVRQLVPATAKWSLSRSILAIALLSGCAQRPFTGVTPQSERRAHATASLFDFDLEENDVVDAPIGTKGFRVDVTNADSSLQPIVLRVFISNQRNGGGYTEVTPLQADMRTSTGLAVTADMLKDKLANDRLIHFEAKGAADTVPRNYYIRYMKLWSGPGLTAPVLFRIDGSAGGFATDALAPSLAFLWKRYSRDENLGYLGLAPLITVYRSDSEADASKPYSAAVGSVLDVGGWFQVGASYHFKGQRVGFIFGLRPEEMARFFSPRP